MKISVTMHDDGRSFRTTRERFISMKQALDIHDPFVDPSPWIDEFNIIHLPDSKEASHGIETPKTDVSR